MKTAIAPRKTHQKNNKKEKFGVFKNTQMNMTITQRTLLLI